MIQSSPLKTFPLFPRRRTVNLDTVWDFKFLEATPFQEVDVASIDYDDHLPVPSAFDAFPAYNGKRGLGVYRCFVEVAPGTKSLLKIGAAAMYCRVFADGRRIGEHYSAYTPFECVVPVSDKPVRELVVVTCNRFDYKTYPLQEIFFDFYAYGGIFRHAELQILPEGNLIEWVGVDTLDCRTGRLKVTVESSGCAATLSVALDGIPHAEFRNVDFSGGRYEFELETKGLGCWSPGHPELHTLTVDNGTDAQTVRFGIRQVKTEKGRILLNGKPVKLLGFCRHEAHPQYGPALPPQQPVADLQLLRDMGCNFVRGSHYPQDPRFLDLCDEFGFLVFEESMGWGQNAAKHFSDPSFVATQVKQTEEMIRAGYNHPSVILRGFLNEGESDVEAARNCYETLIKLIREKDPFRLLTYACNHTKNDLFLDLLDVVSFNIYPGWYAHDWNDEKPLGEILPTIHAHIEKLKERGLEDKPFILAEIGAGAIYGWHDPICAHWSEEYQDEYLKTVCGEIVANDRIAGVALWQFCDCRTYRGGGALMRPRAFNNKGIVDEYRRPKTAYRSVREIFRNYDPSGYRNKA